MQKVVFKAGETIIREGDEGDTAFFIVSGMVDVAVGRDGKARTVGRLTTGEVFGEMCLIDPGRAPRPSSRPATRNASPPPIRISSPRSRRTRNAPSDS